MFSILTLFTNIIYTSLSMTIDSKTLDIGIYKLCHRLWSPYDADCARCCQRTQGKRDSFYFFILRIHFHIGYLLDSSKGFFGGIAIFNDFYSLSYFFVFRFSELFISATNKVYFSIISTRRRKTTNVPDSSLV